MTHSVKFKVSGEYTGFSLSLPQGEKEINRNCTGLVPRGARERVVLPVWLAEFLFAVAHEDRLDNANPDEECGERTAAVADEGERQPSDRE